MKLVLAALVLIATQAQADQVFKDGDWVIDTPAVLTIRSDGGGNIHDYADLVETMGSKQVRIEGVCKSSCTMFLGMENVCVSPTAFFGFHGPSSNDESIRHLMNLVEKIAEHHPAAIGKLFREDWGLDQDFTWLTGAEVLALAPALHACK